MAHVVVFHHIRGLTDGVLSFAEALRAGRHEVSTPDLFDGLRPTSIDEGLAYVQETGGDELAGRALRAVEALPPGLVYAGFSWGAALAQEQAQTRAGSRGALLYEGCLPVTGEWAVGPWPDGLPVQVHGMVADPYFALEGDLDSARELVATVGGDRAELFVYPGDRHLFTDSSLQSWDPTATELVVQRSLAFLDRWGEDAQP